jgi:hypothetical protein
MTRIEISAARCALSTDREKLASAPENAPLAPDNPYTGIGRSSRPPAVESRPGVGPARILSMFKKLAITGEP